MLISSSLGVPLPAAVVATMVVLAVAQVLSGIVRRQTRRIAQLLAQEDESSRRQRDLLAAMEQEIARKLEAESRLRESEQKYRVLFERNPNPMWVFDDETLRFLAVNEAAIRHYGYSREESSRWT